MKRYFSFIALLFLLCMGVNAYSQVNTYTFSQSSGVYSEITGTLVDSSTSVSGATSLDDVNFSGRTIPFAFNFGGISYTTYNINTNGQITFGATLPSTTNYSPISSTSAYDGAGAAFGRDLQGLYGFTANRTSGNDTLKNVSGFTGVAVGRVVGGTGIPTGTRILSFDSGLGIIVMSAAATSTATAATFNCASGIITSTTTGTVGNRIHIIQWKNFKKFGATLDNYNFQIRLYENGNKIEFMYGSFINGTSRNQVQVGLRGATNADFNNRKTQAVADWSATLAGTNNYDTCRINDVTVPASGLTFTFTPPVYTDDVGVSANLAPSGSYIVGSAPIQPSATVKNYGTANQTNFPVVYKITGPAGYQDSVTTSVTANNQLNVNFPGSFNPSIVGTYNVTIYTELSTDQNRINDTLKTSFTVDPQPNYGNDSGYFYANNLATNQPSFPKYSYKDTTGSKNLVLNGTAAPGTTLIGSLDDGYFVLSLKQMLVACGQDSTNKFIKYNGVCYDSIFPCSNGIVGLTQAYGTIPINDFNIDGAQVANNAILPLWKDFNLGSIGTGAGGNRLSYRAKGNQLIITYDKATAFSPATDWVSFQLVLEIVTGCGGANSNFRFTYADTTTGQTSASFVNNYLAQYSAVPPAATTFRNYVVGYTFTGNVIPYTGYVSSGNPFPAFPTTQVSTKRPIFDLSSERGLAVEFGPNQNSLNKFDPKYLKLGVAMEGLQLGGRVRDTVTVVLRDASVAPYKIVESVKIYLDSANQSGYSLGRKVAELSLAQSLPSYYIVVQHRNSVNVWSATAQSFSGDTLSYDFTTNVSQAYGSNEVVVNGAASMFGGEVVRDGCVDLSDITAIFNDAGLFVSGPYVQTDCNWDEFVDLSDLVIASNNSSLFVCEATPGVERMYVVEPKFEVRPEVPAIIIPDSFQKEKEEWLRNNHPELLKKETE